MLLECQIKHTFIPSGCPYRQSWCLICRTHSPCRHRGNKLSKPSKPSQQGWHENQLIHPQSFWNAGMYTDQPSWPIGGWQVDWCSSCTIVSRFLCAHQLFSCILSHYAKIFIFCELFWEINERFCALLQTFVWLYFSYINK